MRLWWRARALAAVVGEAPSSGGRVSALWPEFAAGGHTDFFQVWKPDGTTLVRSDANAGRDLPAPTAIAAHSPTLYDLGLPDGHRGRAVALSIWTPDAILTLVVASEREALDSLEQGLHLALIGGVALTLVFAIGLALIAVQRSLRPLTAFSEAAARMAADPQTPHVPVAALPAELRPIGETLEQALHALVASVARERRFARDVAHELRTPLAEMRGLAEQSLRATVDPDARQRLLALLDSLHNMSCTVDGLLALARYEAGLDAPAIEPVELAALVRRQIELNHATVAARELTVAATLPHEYWVMTDAVLIERMIANLIGNSTQHVPFRSGVRILLDPELASLAISNPAPTLAAAAVPQLGKVLLRSAPAHSDSSHAGLGLALCSALARQLELALAFELVTGELTVTISGLKPLLED